MTTRLSDAHAAALRAACDTFFPAIARPDADDPTGFWGRRASDLGIDTAVAGVIQQLPYSERSGLFRLLEALAAHGLTVAEPEAREQLIDALQSSSAQAARGIASLRRLTLLLAYTITDDDGRNPNWRAFGYPGPLTTPPAVARPLRPLVPSRDSVTLEADVCIVGSGAGGGVIGGTLAAAGHRVVVLEAGAYYTEADFPQLELWAYQHLFWRGGMATTTEGNVSLLAGANLGAAPPSTT
jgi:hypothetical protein